MILGIDYSLTSTGLAVLCDDGSTDTCTIKTPADDGTLEAQIDRLEFIADAVESWADLGADDTVVIEGLLHHAKSAHRAKIIGGWWAIIRRVRAAIDDPIIVATPKTRAQYATGDGGAKKPEVVKQVAARYPQFDIHGDDNIADAVALVAIGARLRGTPIDPDLPGTHLSAMRALTEGKP